MTTSFNADQLISANNAALAHFQSVATTALAAVESLAALNISYARESLENASKNSQDVLLVKTPQEAAALQTKIAQPAAEKLASYTRSVYQISSGAAQQIADQVKSQFEGLNKAAQDAASNFAKSAPFGADIIQAAVKQSIDASNTAYASLEKAGKQAAELAQSNLDKISTAAVKTSKAK